MPVDCPRRAGFPQSRKFVSKRSRRRKRQRRRRKIMRRKKAEEKAERLKQEQWRTVSLTEETDLFRLTTLRQSEAGVSAAPLEDPPAVAAREMEEAISARLNATLARARFFDASNDLVGQAREALQSTSRAIVLVQVPTTSVSSFTQMLEIAKKACDLYLGGTGPAGTRPSSAS
jgi:hypothetical protein